MTRDISEIDEPQSLADSDLSCPLQLRYWCIMEVRQPMVGYEPGHMPGRVRSHFTRYPMRHLMQFGFVIIISGCKVGDELNMYAPFVFGFFTTAKIPLYSEMFAIFW